MSASEVVDSMKILHMTSRGRYTGLPLGDVATRIEEVSPALALLCAGASQSAMGCAKGAGQRNVNILWRARDMTSVLDTLPDEVTSCIYSYLRPVISHPAASYLRQSLTFWELASAVGCPQHHKYIVCKFKKECWEDLLRTIYISNGVPSSKQVKLIRKLHIKMHRLKYDSLCVKGITDQFFSGCILYDDESLVIQTVKEFELCYNIKLHVWWWHSEKCCIFTALSNETLDSSTVDFFADRGVCVAPNCGFV